MVVLLTKASVQRSRGQWLQVLLTREIDRAALSGVFLPVVSFFAFFSIFVHQASTSLSRGQVSPASMYFDDSPQSMRD